MDKAQSGADGAAENGGENISEYRRLLAGLQNGDAAEGEEGE